VSPVPLSHWPLPDKLIKFSRWHPQRHQRSTRFGPDFRALQIREGVRSGEPDALTHFMRLRREGNPACFCCPQPFKRGERVATFFGSRAIYMGRVPSEFNLTRLRHARASSDSGRGLRRKLSRVWAIGHIGTHSERQRLRGTGPSTATMPRSQLRASLTGWRRGAALGASR